MCKFLRNVLAALLAAALLSGMACAELNDDQQKWTTKYHQAVVEDNPFDGETIKMHSTQQEIFDSLVKAGYLDEDYDWAMYRSTKKRILYLVNSYINAMQDSNGRKANTKIPYTISIVTVNGYNTYGTSVKDRLKAVKIDGKDIRKTIYKNEIEDINLSFLQEPGKGLDLVEADIKFTWESVTPEDILAGLRDKNGKEVLTRKDDFGDKEYIYKNKDDNTISFYNDILLVIATQDLLK